ncbi:MAG: hypothetical protein Q9226_006167 [Calogaya cf. arnoldii]
MIDANPSNVGPEERVGIFLPFEIDCWLVAKTQYYNDEDKALFSLDHFFKILAHLDRDRYGRMTKKAIKDALKNAQIHNDVYFIGWDSTAHDSPRHTRAREGFREQYLLSQLKVENPLGPRDALDRVIAGLRCGLSYEEVTSGLNRLYRQQRDPQRPQETQTYSVADVKLLQEYLKFVRHQAYQRWNAVAYNDPRLIQMANELRH